MNCRWQSREIIDHDGSCLLLSLALTCLAGDFVRVTSLVSKYGEVCSAGNYLEKRTTWNRSVLAEFPTASRFELYVSYCYTSDFFFF